MGPVMAFAGFGTSGHMTPPRTSGNEDTKSTATTITNAVLNISSVSGPTALAIDQEGTWTVNVKEASSSNLHYSVKWGDENTMLRAAAVMMPVATSSATFTHAYSAKGTYQPTFTVTDNSGNTVSKSATKVQVGKNVVAHITSITPGSGAAGTTITLVGSGFASTTAVHFGDKTIASTTVQNSDTISFAIPSTTPAGTYKVWVKGNATNQGKSNTVTFKVTATPKAHLSVNGIDAPVTLIAGTEGTWTVHASSNVSGNLHYSVVWGDENMLLRAMSAALPQTLQTSASFTHAYDAAGTYQPKFTITDDAGHSTGASATVQVTAQ